MASPRHRCSSFDGVVLLSSEGWSSAGAAGRRRGRRGTRTRKINGDGRAVAENGAVEVGGGGGRGINNNDGRIFLVLARQAGS